MKPGLALLLLSAVVLAEPTPLAEMAAIERDTERLAHRLLELAKTPEGGAFFAEGAHAEGFPPKAGEVTRFPLGVLRRSWVPGTGAVPPADALAFLRSLLGTSGRFKLQPVASRRAGDRLEAVLKLRAAGTTPNGARIWLRGRLEAACRPAEARLRLLGLRLLALESLERPAPLFRDVTAECGLAREDPPVLEHPTLGLAAYGAACGDVDADGRIDLFVTAHDTNHLLLNRGRGRFEERAVATPRPATAPLLLDFDNDGDLDIFCSANGPQMLLENRRVPDGTLVFRDVSEAMGVAVATIGFSVAAADVNGDARPDLYVTAYNDYGPVAPDSWVAGRNGLPNLLFVSRPDGRYEEAAQRWGVADTRWSYAAQFCDVDEDGALDLYVANDFGAGNALYCRRGDRFVDEAAARGVFDGAYAMGVSFGDMDNDGRIDLHVTRMSSTAGRRILARLDSAQVPALPVLMHLSAGNGLYRNLGAGRFEDVTSKAGPFPAGWAWGGGFVDVDNDGFEDLYTPNGHLSGTEEKDT